MPYLKLCLNLCVYVLNNASDDYVCVVVLVCYHDNYVYIATTLFVDDKGGENCANIIYAENYRNRHKLRGSSYTMEISDICCHQSKRGRMLSQDFYRVLISDKGIHRDQQKEGSSFV